MKWRLVCCILSFAVVAPVSAQPPGESIRLTIHPAQLPSPVLKYQLLPAVSDQNPGNAATQYYRAFSPEWFSWRWRTDLNEKLPDYLNTPFKDLPRNDLDWILKAPQFRELDLGARREYCDWGFLDRIRTEGLNLLLPDVQGFRGFANILAMRARLEMADGHYDKAAYTLQTGFALSKDVGAAQIFICALVGVALANVQAGQVEQWIQLSDSPNLYWALTGLPQPFIPLQKPLQGERMWLFATMPLLKEIETSRLDAAQMQVLVEQTSRMMRMLSNGKDNEAQAKMVLMALALRFYPEAKRALIAEGRKAEDVEAMPMLHVYLLHSYRNFRQLQDDIDKWFSLPYAQSRAGLEQTEKQYRNAKAKQLAVPFIDVLPAAIKVYSATARLDRRIAALRTVEAIRLYAAGHEGKLPTALTEITEVPLPLDPMTAKLFEYKTNGNKATLHAPAPAEDRGPHNALTYEITLEK